MTTTTVTTDTPLADIVTARPASARLLESLDLDYCCGGRRTLAEACEEAGSDPTEVLARLEELGAGSGDADTEGAAAWATMGPAELVEHLESTHHRYLHGELPRLSELSAKVAGVHGDNHPELREVDAAYTALRADLEPHLMKEERVLFPMIRELDASQVAPDFHCGSLSNPISMMMIEHDRAGELLAELRRLTDGYTVPEDACGSYRALYDGLEELEADTHMHVHKENNLLFPAVVALEAQRS